MSEQTQLIDLWERAPERREYDMQRLAMHDLAWAVEFIARAYSADVNPLPILRQIRRDIMWTSNPDKIKPGKLTVFVDPHARTGVQLIEK